MQAIDAIGVAIDMKERYTGKIIHFNDKGYGFIESKGLMIEEEFVPVFAHVTCIQKGFPREFSKGQYVRFNVVRSEKGLNALSIEPYDPYQEDDDGED